MPNKSSIYLDTSVISAYFDERALERMQETKDFFLRIKDQSNVFISPLVINEISQTSNVSQREKLLDFSRQFTLLEITPDAEVLAKQYLSNQIFNENSFLDALHVAIASVNSMDFLVSWNFKDIVKVKTRRRVNLTNSVGEVHPIEIIAPVEY
jgi:predicted nucleic acid-binding protein